MVIFAYQIFNPYERYHSSIMRSFYFKDREKAEKHRQSSIDEWKVFEHTQKEPRHYGVVYEIEVIE